MEVRFKKVRRRLEVELDGLGADNARSFILASGSSAPYLADASATKEWGLKLKAAKYEVFTSISASCQDSIVAQLNFVRFLFTDSIQ